MPSEPRSNRRDQGRRLARVPLLALVAALALGSSISACGSAGSPSTTEAHTGGASGSRHAPSAATTIRTVSGRDGTYLADGSGRALYMWLGDGSGRSNCSGDCALSWPPLTTGATPKVAGGAAPADVGTITRSGGIRQVTYKGHPLYHFVVDSGPGTTKGQGSDSFGARWWLVSPSGAAITVNGGSSVSPPISY